ncbi:ABC transporter [Lentzea sp. NBRC 105346]|uniref:ABC transporter permease n=1 Tax=Lentzea sp. NBRC 105346 TaxID=3032205 RepID=UPI0024A2CCE5|nr:ABC transporter permease [Lentzea sp. NBRC 105346]GLZ31605.1 ABC transporter [Lentzea sp. NBRC 105346]
MNAEWLKLRTVRAPYALVAAIGAVLAIGMVISWLMVLDFDTSAEQANFASADNSVIVTPFTQFCVAALGALIITSEYASGMIRTSLTAVPNRMSFAAAKIAVTGAVSFGIAVLCMTLSYASSWLIMGDRPPPVAPWDTVGDLLPSALASIASITVAGLLGLGLGMLLRSSAGALVTIGALLWVLPSITTLLPEPWGTNVSAVMLPYLVPQLAGTIPDAPLSTFGAGLAMAAYMIITLGAGSVTLVRRGA